MISQLKKTTKNFIGNINKHFVNTKFRNIILNYHSVNDYNKFSIHPSEFRKQIQYLVSEFKVINLSDMYEVSHNNETQNYSRVSLTFDDGYQDNYVYAFPILKDFNINPTIFVTTAFINREVDITASWTDYKGMSALTWDQIGEMASYGVEIGSHTHTHSNLAKMSFDQTVNEFLVSKEIIKNQIGVYPITIAYPFGQPYNYVSHTMQAAKVSGYKSAYTTLCRDIRKNDYIFSLPRIRIDPWDSLDEFSYKVHGYWDYISYVQMIKSKLLHC